MLHGNLHSSSIFINDDNCKVIAAGFGFYGPIGFDVGNILASLLLNYIGHSGLTEDAGHRQQHQQFLLEQVSALWHQFESNFSQLMAQECREPMLQNTAYQQRFISQIFADSLGYSGCELIRRVVGMAHVADLEQISNKALRTQSEHKVLKLGRQLIMQRRELANIEQVLTMLNYLE